VVVVAHVVCAKEAYAREQSIQSRRSARMYTQTHMHVCTQARTHIHTSTRTCTHAHVLPRTSVMAMTRRPRCAASTKAASSEAASSSLKAGRGLKQAEVEVGGAASWGRRPCGKQHQAGRVEPLCGRLSIQGG